MVFGAGCGSPGTGTLKPTAVGEYGGVRLSWASVPGVRSCEVWRSARREDGWAMVASGQAGAAWFDAQAAAGLTWFYRIRPEIAGCDRQRPDARGRPRVRRPGARARRLARTRRSPFGRGVGRLRVGLLRGDGIRVVDLGDAASPREVASVALTDARAVGVAGTVACVADGERGIVLLDVSDPLAPRVTGVRYLQGPRSVVMSSGVAYVACGAGGVRLVDVSDPRAPERLGAIESGDARDLCR